MVVEMRSRIRTKSLKLLGAPDFAAGPPDHKFADLAPFRRTIRVPIRAGKLRSDLEDKVARSWPSQALTGRSQIVLQILEHVVDVVARIEIDLVVDRAILEHDRALRPKTTRQAFDLLFDGFLAGLGATDAPHGFESYLAVTVGAVGLPILRRRRLQPVKLRRETVAAPLVGGGDLCREILFLLREILLVLQRLRKRDRG